MCGRPAGAPLVLVPVGVGTAYARAGEVQSCYLVRAGDAAVALDLGAGALNRLQQEMPPERLAALVISHLHPDHFADLLSLRVYMAHGPGAGHVLRVLGPPGLRDRLAGFAGSEGWDAFRFEDLGEGEEILDLAPGLVLRHRRIPHLEPTHASRLEHGGASVCFGADCRPNGELPELARDCDLLICECSFGAEAVPEGVPHLNGEQAGRMATAAGARRLLLTHCFPEFDRDAALAAARAAFDGRVDWARQGEAVPA